VEAYFGSRVDLLADVLEKEVLAKHAALGTTTWASRIMLERSPWDALNKLAREGRMPNRLAYSIARSDRDLANPAEFFQSLPDLDDHGNDYLWSMGVGTQSLDSGPPGICSTMEAPRAVKEREICRIQPGNAYAKAVYAAIRSHQRMAVGHVYGDKALDYFFDEIERAMKDDPSITLEYVRSRKFTSDHCGFYPRPAQVERLVHYSMILSCGVRYLDRSAPWLESYGQFYANWIVPLNSILKGGAKVVYEDSGLSPELGSGLTYFRAVPYAMTRKNGKGQVIAPAEAVDRITLMKMMTSWAAEFVGRPKVIGTLEAGKWADFVVLNQDYFSVPVEEIAKTFPLMTVTGGKIVVLRNDYAQELGVPPVGPQINFTFQDPPGFAEGD
jgi:predicted amidohydrolase YtcJ